MSLDTDVTDILDGIIRCSGCGTENMPDDCEEGDECDACRTDEAEYSSDIRFHPNGTVTYS